MKKPSFLLLSLLSLWSFVFLNCESFVPWGVIEFDKERFDEEWAAWEAQGLVNYSVKQAYSSVYPRKIRTHIIVQENAIIHKEFVDSWSLEQLEKDPDYIRRIDSFVKTISEIYDHINRVSESKEWRGIIIRITYNDEFHFPELIEISDLEGGGSSRCLSEFIPLAPAAEEE